MIIYFTGELKLDFDHDPQIMNFLSEESQCLIKSHFVFSISISFTGSRYWND